jgi:hypothetical protein
MTTDIDPEPSIARVVDDLTDKRKMRDVMTAYTARKGEFSSEYEMNLAAICSVPSAREDLYDSLTEMFEANSLDGASARCIFSETEAVIGAGYAAAVYCAARVRSGKPKPIVFEASGPELVGGTFAMSDKPVFRLNSGNRPGKAGLPGDMMASLNYIPGAVIQPSMLSSENYQTNQDMALAIRLALAQFAYVVPGVEVSTVSEDGEVFPYVPTDYNLTFKRVLDATGLGGPRDPGNGDTVLDFGQFMAKMGTPFPLKGLRKVAVIGGGDAGKCAVESLMGIAPCHSSLAALDFVQRVDWFTPGLPGDKEGWKATQRGRYGGICQFLGKRVFVQDTTGEARPSFEGALVNGSPYDLAVLCTGAGGRNLFGRNSVVIDGERTDGNKFYRIGVAADLPFTPTERDNGLTRIPQNRVAMFRYGPRIAALASTLD